MQPQCVRALQALTPAEPALSAPRTTASTPQYDALAKALTSRASAHREGRMQTGKLRCLQPALPAVVLVACGSYNPPTLMHLRMFDVAADALREVRRALGAHRAVTSWAAAPTQRFQRALTEPLRASCVPSAERRGGMGRLPVAGGRRVREEGLAVREAPSCNVRSCGERPPLGRL